MKPKSPVQKNNLVVFPYEYTHVYPYRYTWYLCIAMIYTSLQEYLCITMIYTSLQEYLYPLIQRKSTCHHFDTHTCTQLYKSIWFLDRAILKAGKYKA